MNELKELVNYLAVYLSEEIYFDFEFGVDISKTRVVLKEAFEAYESVYGCKIRIDKN